MDLSGAGRGLARSLRDPEQLVRLYEEAVAFSEVHAVKIASALFLCQPVPAGPELRELPQGLFRMWIMG